MPRSTTRARMAHPRAASSDEANAKLNCATYARCNPPRQRAQHPGRASVGKTLPRETHVRDRWARGAALYTYAAVPSPSLILRFGGRHDSCQPLAFGSGLLIRGFDDRERTTAVLSFPSPRRTIHESQRALTADAVRAFRRCPRSTRRPHRRPRVTRTRAPTKATSNARSAIELELRVIVERSGADSSRTIAASHSRRPRSGVTDNERSLQSSQQRQTDVFKTVCMDTTIERGCSGEARAVDLLCPARLPESWSAIFGARRASSTSWPAIAACSCLSSAQPRRPRARHALEMVGRTSSVRVTRVAQCYHRVSAAALRRGALSTSSPSPATR
jgi:hypothetical protein